MTTKSTCLHRRTQFRKAADSGLCVLYCLDCDWQKRMSFEAALKRITQSQPSSLDPS
jgi:hypothetical protein